MALANYVCTCLHIFLWHLQEYSGASLLRLIFVRHHKVFFFLFFFPSSSQDQSYSWGQAKVRHG